MKGLILTAWLVCGLPGGYLLWLDVVCKNWHDWPPPRVSPAAILGIAGASLFGPIILIAGLIITEVRWEVTARKSEHWFFRPIGGGKR